MRIDVRNNTTNPIRRGGHTIPPDGQWHTINVPPYRFSEVISSTYLEHRYPSSVDRQEVDEMVEDGPSPEPQTEVDDSTPGTTPDDPGPDDGLPDDSTPDDPANEGDTGDDDTGDEGEDGEADDSINLDELDYAELQAMAKSYGIKANQGREALVEQILEADEEGS